MGYFRPLSGNTFFRGFQRGVCYTQNGQFGLVVCIFPFRKKTRQHVTHTSTALFPTTRARESIYKGGTNPQDLETLDLTLRSMDIGCLHPIYIISSICHIPNFPGFGLFGVFEGLILSLMKPLFSPCVIHIISCNTPWYIAA
jgi:hypothetical protein